MTDTQPASIKTVLATRPDGLGQRLLAVLRAMHLAEILGVDYAFTWPDRSANGHHALPTAVDTFAAEYLAKHVVPPGQEGYAELNQHVANLEELTRLAEGSRGWLLRLSSAFKNVGPELRQAPKGHYRRLFQKIRFRSYVNEAIVAAYQTELPSDAIAIHLRAGDIIYGRYRFRDKFTRKAIALPLARWLIEQWTAVGRKVVLCGQDPAVADLFRGRSDVIIAADLAQRFPKPIQVALFEIVLMSRCNEIHAGASAFAELAGCLGDVKVKGTKKSISPDRQIEIIRDDLSDPARMKPYPDLQTAFAAWTAALMLERQKNLVEAVPMLEIAIRHDPINGYYRLKLASSLYSLRRDADADAVLQNLLADDANHAAEARSVALGMLKERASAQGAFTMAAEHLVFAEAAERGAPLSAHLMAHVERALAGEKVAKWSAFAAE